MGETLDLEKKLTANQLYKIYKDEGGTKTFSEWLTREKTKGIFPINSQLNEEVNERIVKIKKEEMSNTVLGFPIKTLAIAGAVIVVAIIASQVIKKK
jgi:hypothetical protein